jgi:hypothetical protein
MLAAVLSPPKTKNTTKDEIDEQMPPLQYDNGEVLHFDRRNAWTANDLTARFATHQNRHFDIATLD